MIVGGLGIIALVFLVFQAISMIPKDCAILSPLALQSFTINTSAKPIYGERCSLGEKDFLLRLFYEDASKAEQALYELKINTPGERQKETITYEGSIVVFSRDNNKVALAVSGDMQGKPVINTFGNFQPPNVEVSKVEKEFLPENELMTASEEEQKEPEPTSSPQTTSEEPTIKSGVWASKWVYPGGDTYRGVIELKDDGTFILTGFKSPDFASGGNYLFSRNTVTLEFTKDLDFWRTYFTNGDAYTAEYEEILEIKNGEKPSVTFDVYKCAQLYGKDCINFLNWLFYLE